MINDITGKTELEMLAFDWDLQKPGLVLTFSTLCCASGTCDIHISQKEMRLEDGRKIPQNYCAKEKLQKVKKTHGSLRL